MYYMSEDGRKFNSAEDCSKYETEVLAKKELEKKEKETARLAVAEAYATYQKALENYYEKYSEGIIKLFNF